MNCPKCFEPLRIAERQGVEIDYCPECRGVWLDKGELDKIIDRTAPVVAPAQPSSYEREKEYSRREPDHGDYKKNKEKKYYKKKKTKHFLEEIFDIFD